MPPAHPAHNLLVITDEIYSELTFDGEHVSIASLPGMAGRTIFLHGFSKAYAMTGFRIGYACGPAELIEAMMKIHQYSMLCASIVSQEAACEAIRHGEPDTLEMREHYRARRNIIVGALNAMGLPCHRPPVCIELEAQALLAVIGHLLSRVVAVLIVEPVRIRV